MRNGFLRLFAEGRVGMHSGSPSHPSAIYFNRKTCVKLKHRLLAACAAAALCAPVFATQVTYSYSGVVDDDARVR